MEMDQLGTACAITHLGTTRVTSREACDWKKMSAQQEAPPPKSQEVNITELWAIESSR